MNNLFVPYKNGKPMKDTHGNMKVYKSYETMIKYCKGLDSYCIYTLEGDGRIYTLAKENK